MNFHEERHEKEMTKTDRVIVGIIFLLLFCSIFGVQTCEGQGFPVPEKVFDAMVFEVRKGRVCDSLQREQAIQIADLNNLVSGHSRAIQLKDGENEALLFVISRWEREYELAKEIHDIDRKAFKSKIKQLFRVVFIEGAVIVVLLVLML
jgi:hypothetical protein